MSGTGLPESLGGTVRRELDRLGSGPPGSAPLAELVSVWPRAVGETIARNAWPARTARDGTLLVHTASSAWAFELQQLERTVRERLGELAPTRLRFVVGPVPEHRAETEPEAYEAIHRPGPRERAQGVEIAREIGDPTLRDAVARAAAAQLARVARTGGPADSSGTLPDS